MPTVPLGRLYGPEMRAFLEGRGVGIRLGTAVKAFAAERGRVVGAALRDGSTLSADWYVAAVPSHRLAGLLPADVAADAMVTKLRNLEPSPITSIHLWFDRPCLPVPHAVLVDCLGQWAFDRGNGYVQVVVSASRELRGVPANELAERHPGGTGAIVPGRSTGDVAPVEGRDGEGGDVRPGAGGGPLAAGAGHAAGQPGRRRRLDRHRLAGHDGRGRPQRGAGRRGRSRKPPDCRLLMHAALC